MNHRTKAKCETCSGRNIRQNLCDLWLGKDKLHTITKHNPQKETWKNWTPLELKTSVLQKIPLGNQKDMHRLRKYLQDTHLIKDLYLEYIKNFQNSTVRNKRFNFFKLAKL